MRVKVQVIRGYEVEVEGSKPESVYDLALSKIEEGTLLYAVVDHAEAADADIMDLLNKVM